MLIQLDEGDVEIAEHAIVKVPTGFAYANAETHDAVAVRADHALRGPDRVALDQGGDDSDLLFKGQYAKLSAQARALGWLLLFDGDTVTAQDITGAVGRCLDGSLAVAMDDVRRAVPAKFDGVRDTLLRTISETPAPDAE